MKKIYLTLLIIGIGSSVNGQNVDLQNNEQIRWKDTSGTWRNQLFSQNNSFLVTAMGNGMHLHFGNGISSASDTWFSNDTNETPSSNVPFIIKSSGYIGIGISSPRDPLHIFEPTNGSGTTLRLDAATNKNPNMLFSINGQTAANIRVNDKGNNELQFQVGSSLIEALTIATDGNVGIGITNPTQKLQVAGTVYSTEVKIEIAAGQGPDYVFEPDYELKTLKETKNYITKNKHLPEIPSAKEMETNGVELGDMNMRLLKKIEELTLYIIEQNEQIEELKSSNARIDKLEKKLLELTNEE